MSLVPPPVTSDFAHYPTVNVGSETVDPKHGPPPLPANIPAPDDFDEPEVPLCDVPPVMPLDDDAPAVYVAPPFWSVETFKTWFLDNGCWYISSMVAHAVALICLGMISMSISHGIMSDDSLSLDAPDVDRSPPMPELAHFEVGNAPLDPTQLTTESLSWATPPPAKSQPAKTFDDSLFFEDEGGGTVTDRNAPQLGGLGGFNIKDLPGPAGRGGVGVGAGSGAHAGIGGAGEGFGSRGKGHREALLGPGGGTKASERAVAAALNWLYRHQTPQGKWSLQYLHQCKGNPCSGSGQVRCDSAATALALLPFLAAGQTQKSKGPYQSCIAKGIAWLIKQQGADGDLSARGEQQMYAHGLATLALCEAFGMSKDPSIGAAAQKAVYFIERAQNQATGGWRYEPQDSGDTSVFGWQIMALKSAQLAGLPVNSSTMENGKKWLAVVAKGEHLGLYCYQPYREVTPTMTAVGMLCSQYLGTARDDPAMLEGQQCLLNSLPENSLMRNTYYWYYATMAMHNMGGPEWDAWNRTMRRVLITSQIKEGCAEGSWDPRKPTLDVWGEKGGRLMTTSFNTLTLEIYYRYLPLFNTDSPAMQTPPASPEIGHDSGLGNK